MSSIALIDLKAQQARIRPLLEAALSRVLDHGSYIMGPEVGELEKKLAAFTGAKQCMACSSGTDALMMALLAKGVVPGDVIFVPSFTFVATAEAPAFLGATPYFVDVLPDTFNMDPSSLKAAVADAKKRGLRPRGIIAVDLFGQPADYDAIGAIAEEEELFVIGDAAQGLGAALGNKKVGTLCELTATSFFPAKPLGGYGDGGAVFTNRDHLADVVRSLLIHGKGKHKYENVRIGLNARLDTLQAAVLLEKLTIFEEELRLRNEKAALYTVELPTAEVTLPSLMVGVSSTWAQYTIQYDHRDEIATACKRKGIPTAIYYPIPLPQQEGYRDYPTVPGGVPVAENLAKTVLSLPMHPYLTDDMQMQVVEAVREAVGHGL